MQFIFLFFCHIVLFSLKNMQGVCIIDWVCSRSVIRYKSNGKTIQFLFQINRNDLSDPDP